MTALSKRDRKDSSSVAARRLVELDKGHRRRVLIWSSVRVLVIWAFIIAVYYLVPESNHTRFGDVLRLIVGLAFFAALLLWQIRQITVSELPELRAAEALGVIFPIFLIVFATLYLSLSHTSPSMFSQRLDHTRALYFTITIFSTVGFGDITPTTDTARILVSLQMILDLAIIGFVVRVLFNAARTNLGPGDDTGSA
ncbi:MAG TPA: potassium channel family protein [Acidimicrobiales bacterium]|nr:potassium channel family protein [Acidimicrobiales bacterium]